MEKPDKLYLRVNRIAPGLNSLMRMHWARRRKEQETWEVLIREAIGNVGNFWDIQSAWAKWQGKTRVLIVRYSTATMDHDNLQSTGKLILDSLVAAKKGRDRGLGLIPDDSPEHIEVEIRAVKIRYRKDAGTEILLDPLEEKDPIWRKTQSSWPATDLFSPISLPE